MADIDTAIRQKRLAIARLNEQIRVLEQAKAVLEGDEPEAQLPLEPPTGRGPKVKGGIRPKSQTSVAVQVLQEAGSPLHISAILERMRVKGVVARKPSLVSALARLVSRKRVFYRAKKPNTFGLLEWQEPGLAKEVSPSRVSHG